MSDGIKAGIGQAVADIGETVIKPVVDEVGKAIEEGVQSVVGSSAPQDPQTQQQKQAEEQKRKQWAMHVIDWHKNLQASQQQVRMQKQQAQQAKQQEEVHEKQQVKQFKIIQNQKRAEMNAAQVAERHTEIKKGVGG